MTCEIHPATLDDTASIVGLFTSRIDVWQRIDAEGRVQTVAYGELNLSERWLYGGTNGGAWMSVETGAIHLNHLLMGAGIPLVAVAAGKVVGYGEAYHSFEAPPIGSVVHIAHLITADDDADCISALITAFAEQAKGLKAQQVTLPRSSEGSGEIALPAGIALKPANCVRRYTVAARTGQVFYRAVDHPSADASVISGWMMPIGRQSSARQAWEMLMPRHWDTISQMKARRMHRLKLSAAGQEAYVVCQQGLYNPRAAEVFCWTPKPLTVQLVASIKDWAHRESYRTLSMLVADDAVKALGTDAEADGYMQETCVLEMA